MVLKQLIIFFIIWHNSLIVLLYCAIYIKQNTLPSGILGYSKYGLVVVISNILGGYLFLGRISDIIATAENLTVFFSFVFNFYLLPSIELSSRIILHTTFYAHIK